MGDPLTPMQAAAYAATLLGELVMLIDARDGKEDFDLSTWGQEALEFLAPIGKEDAAMVVRVALEALARGAEVQLYRSACEINRACGVGVVEYSDVENTCHPGTDDDDGKPLRALLCPWVDKVVPLVEDDKSEQSP